MQTHKRFIEITLYVLILGLALFLRIRRLDTTGIWSDQAFTLNTAMRWVNGDPMPLASNKSSAGFVNPLMIETCTPLPCESGPTSSASQC